MRGQRQAGNQPTQSESSSFRLGITFRTILAIALVAVSSIFVPAWGLTCPSLLQDARRLILVTAPTMNTLAATVRLFERDTIETPWRVVHSAEPAVLGRFGMGWGQGFRDLARGKEPLKSEGDMRTPAGIYPTRSTFGFAASWRKGYLRIKAGDTICVDDPSSPAYNTITSRALIGTKTHAEAMGNVKLYRRGLIIDYPGAAAKTGSCIFIHVWRARTQGTAGCIAVPEPRVAALQDFAENGAVVAVLPESALAHFEHCLPDVTQKSGRKLSIERAPLSRPAGDQAAQAAMFLGFGHHFPSLLAALIDYSGGLSYFGRII